VVDGLPVPGYAPYIQYTLLAAFSEKDFPSLSFALFTTWGSDPAVGGGGNYGLSPSLGSIDRLSPRGSGGTWGSHPDSPRPRRVWLAALALRDSSSGPVGVLEFCLTFLCATDIPFARHFSYKHTVVVFFYKEHILDHALCCSKANQRGV
jgi:hypothetical protein